MELDYLLNGKENLLAWLNVKFKYDILQQASLKQNDGEESIETFIDNLTRFGKCLGLNELTSSAYGQSIGRKSSFIATLDLIFSCVNRKNYIAFFLKQKIFIDYLLQSNEYKEEKKENEHLFEAIKREQKIADTSNDEAMHKLFESEKKLGEECKKNATREILLKHGYLS